MAAKKKKKKARPAKARTARKPARKPAKRATKAPKRKTAKRTPVRKAKARRAPAKAKAKKTARRTGGDIKGEGNYSASRRFRKDETDFVRRNRSKIPAMAQDAEAAMAGAEGNDLRAAEREAGSHAHLPEGASAIE